MIHRYSPELNLPEETALRLGRDRARVVGLGGLAGSGKDAFAAALSRHSSRPTFVMGMSDTLREYVFVMDPIIDKNGNHYKDVRQSLVDSGMSDDDVYVQMKHDYPELRRFLQVMGTDLFRNKVSQSYWVDCMKHSVEAWIELNGHDANVVVTGMRFPNELSAVKELEGSVLLYVQRPVVEMSASSSAHNSEKSVTSEDFDEVVYNDSTLNELDTKARSVAKFLGM